MNPAANCKRILTGLSFVLAISGTAGAEGQARELLERFPLPYEAEFVGSEKCGACHTLHLQWQRTHNMALTGRSVNLETRETWFSPARLEKPTVDEEGEAGKLRYRRTAEGVVLEAAADRDFRNILDQVEVAVVFGSGARRTSPISVEKGKSMRELRLAYTSAYDSWILAPGAEYEADPLGAPKSTADTHRCFFCHATLLDWKEERLDAEASVLGVHCERCHGPGSAHLQAVLDSESDPKIRNPGLLPAREQVIFCSQCHRQPVFIDVDPEQVLTRDSGLARHAGASLMLSKCFWQSPPESTISCIQCHDPHRNVDPEVDPYQKTCLRCHDSPAEAHRYENVTSASNCIPCHMRTEQQGFQGVSYTDHWIRIPSKRALLEPQEEDDYLRYLERSYRVAVAEEEPREPQEQAALLISFGEVLYRLEDYEEAFSWLRRGLAFSPRVTSPIPLPLILRPQAKAAEMFRQSGKVDEAIQVLERITIDFPFFAPTHVQLGQLHESQGRLDEAVSRYRKAVEVQPELAFAHVRLGAGLTSKGELDEAREHLQKALVIYPSDAEAHYLLAEAWRWSARPHEALEHYREALRLSPDSLPALTGAARVLATHPDSGVRDPEEAVRLAERAAAQTGYQDPTILDTLAAAYAASGDFETAVKAAEKAVALAEAAGAEEVAVEEIRERLRLYQQGQPFLAKERR